MDPKKLKAIAKTYYSRKDIQLAIFNQAKGKELIPRYFKGEKVNPESLVIG